MTGRELQAILALIDDPSYDPEYIDLSLEVRALVAEVRRLQAALSQASRLHSLVVDFVDEARREHGIA